MSKLYNSKKAGTAVLSGKVTSISDDRMQMNVEYREYDAVAKKGTNKTKTVISGMPLNDTYKVGQNVSVVGYIQGPTNVSALHICNTTACFESDMIAVVSGHVKKAALNTETKEDGSPKLKKDGVTPRKPHFDVVVAVNEGDVEVNHIVKVYNSPKFQNEGEPSNIERYQKRFENFVNADETPTRVTIVTQPGQSFEYEMPDGQVYHGCSHMSINSLDMEYEYSRKKSQDKPVEAAEKTQAATPENTQAAPSTPSASAVAQKEEITEVSGFDEDLEMEFN